MPHFILIKRAESEIKVTLGLESSLRLRYKICCCLFQKGTGSSDSRLWLVASSSRPPSFQRVVESLSTCTDTRDGVVFLDT